MGSLLWGGVFYLSQILQALINESSQRLLKDLNGNFYYASQILQSGNAGLLNALFYYNPDGRTITWVSQVNAGGNSVNSQTGIPNNPINSWVNALGNLTVSGPAVQVPPPAAMFSPQPLSPPSAANQGSPGLSGAQTPFVAGSSYYPVQPTESRPLYTVYA